MADFTAIQIAAAAGALALAAALFAGAAPFVARVICRRLRTELARDVLACQQGPAESLIPAPPHPRIVRLALSSLSGLWLVSSLVMWSHLGVAAWPYCCALVALLVLALTDLDVQLLPGQLVGAVLWAGVLAALFGVVYLPLADSVLGVVAGWALFAIPNELLGATGRWDDPVIGQGDISLLAACGAWLGPQNVILAASIAVALALLARILLLRVWPDAPSRQPFGPLIAAATAAVFGISCVTPLAL